MVQAVTEAAGKPFHEISDRAYGLSVGAINATALLPLRETGEPLYTPESLRHFYHQHTDDIFDTNFWSFGGLIGSINDIENLERVLESELGNLRLSDFADGLGIVVLDAATQEVRVLTSEDAARNPDLDFRMVDLIRASAAAPVYFPQSSIRSVSGKIYQFTDAGFVSPNQAHNVARHMEDIYGKDAMPALVSYGTGKNTKPINLSEWPESVRQIAPATELALATRAKEVLRDTHEKYGERFIEMDMQAGPLKMDSPIAKLRNYVRDNPHLIDHETVEHIAEIVSQSPLQVGEHFDLSRNPHPELPDVPVPVPAM